MKTNFSPTFVSSNLTMKNNTCLKLLMIFLWNMIVFMRHSSYTPPLELLRKWINIFWKSFVPFYFSAMFQNTFGGNLSLLVCLDHLYALNNYLKSYSYVYFSSHRDPYSLSPRVFDCLYYVNNHNVDVKKTWS